MSRMSKSAQPGIPCFFATAALALLISGCSTGNFIGSYDAAAPAPIVQTPANFDTALRQSRTALKEQRGDPDTALYNIGVILAHPANPRRDYAKAAQSFHTLVNEYPRSVYLDQAKTWLLVIDQQQKLADQRRALNRERELLQQERQRLNATSERSQQLDVEIDKWRRQSLGR